MSDHRWSFPEDSTRQFSGINSIKFDSSEGELKKLIRELCQNSCDARAKDCVKIEFQKFSIPTSEVPDVDGFKRTVRHCYNFASKMKEDKTTARYFSQMLEKLDEKHITVLRISDYGTTGAVGSNISDPMEITSW